MSQKYYSTEEKKYLLKNGSRFTVKELSKKIGRPEYGIRMFLQRSNINPVPGKKYPQPVLTEEQKKFIRDNHLILSPYRMSKKLNITNYSVRHFMTKNGISFFNERRSSEEVQQEKKEIIRFQVREKTFVRPPAVYSNPDYSKMYA